MKACLVLHDGSSATVTDIQAHCAGSLAEYKRPCQIEFRESLPKGPTGKILKRELREA